MTYGSAYPDTGPAGFRSQAPEAPGGRREFRTHPAFAAPLAARIQTDRALWRFVPWVVLTRKIAGFVNIRCTRQSTLQNGRLILHDLCASTEIGANGLPPRGSSCGSRQWSMMEIFCTHPTVQWGAHGFLVKYSRSISANVYFSRGIAG